MLKEEKIKVAIVDYGMGNLFSVKLACEKAGLKAVISNNKKEVLEAEALILPGVGAFGNAMETLQNLGLIDPIKEFIASGRPFLGICLGMQLLMSKSEEFGLHKGLDIIKGRVVKFPQKPDKVPQVGWNKIIKPKNKKLSWVNSLLEGVSDGEHMYFVHSFYCIPDSKQVFLSETNYAGLNYCSSLQNKNVFACQFHPEKSGKNGLTIYKNFAKLVCQKKN